MNSISTYVSKVKHGSLFLWIALVLLLCACKPGDYNFNSSVNVRDAAPDEKARADLLYAQAERERMQTEQDRQRAQIEIDLLAETAKLNQQLSIEQRRSEIMTDIQKANTETGIIEARGQAEIRAIDTQSAARAQADLANANAWARFVTVGSYGLIVITCGLAASLAIASAGRSVAYVKKQAAMSDILLIQAANRDLPPLIITRSGYLLDLMTGERAKLSDPTGVNKLRTLSMTRLLEASAMAHATVTVARDNRRRLSGGTAAADVLPGISASIPLMLPVDTEDK